MTNCEYLELAIKAAHAGGNVLRKGFDSDNKQIELKGFADPVTKFDKESESAIVSCISGCYPDHSILTEEELSTVGTQNIKWIVDPLDGTVNFTHKIPYICVSIGLEIDNEIVLGVIYNPILEELYYAAKDEGAYLNDTRIKVSDISDPGYAMVVTGFPYEREGRIAEVLKPMETIIKDYEGFRRLGSAAMDMAYVASGRCDIFYEENLKPWDMAGGSVIIKEAGGVVTDYYGDEFNVYKKTILAANPNLHTSMVDLLKNVSSPE